jgi:hypothetical protein
MAYYGIHAPTRIIVSDEDLYSGGLRRFTATGWVMHHPDTEMKEPSTQLPREEAREAARWLQERGRDSAIFG